MSFGFVTGLTLVFVDGVTGLGILTVETFGLLSFFRLVGGSVSLKLMLVLTVWP